jgi:hypothetical protein
LIGLKLAEIHHTVLLGSIKQKEPDVKVAAQALND